jgi:hypothetical protein
MMVSGLSFVTFHHSDDSWNTFTVGVKLRTKTPTYRASYNRDDAIVFFVLAIKGISRRLGTHIGFL